MRSDRASCPGGWDRFIKLVSPWRPRRPSSSLTVWIGHSGWPARRVAEATFDAGRGRDAADVQPPLDSARSTSTILGLDGISFPLVMLTSFLSLLAMAASWPITKHVKAYCILFLLLETGMLGVFLALDFFLFYVFWEVMLLPMYFLIGVWGGPRREYAAIKFFLYTLRRQRADADRDPDALLQRAI